MFLRPIVRFMSQATQIAKTTVHARINQAITVPNFKPNPACYDTMTYPMKISFTVLEEEASALLNTLKNLEGVLDVNGEKTAYGEKKEPEFIYRQTLGGVKAF